MNFSRVFYLKLVFSKRECWYSSILSEGQELGGSEETGYGPHIRENGFRQLTGSWLSMPRLLWSALAWNEFRKNPRAKLYSKHLKYSLIYCSSKTSTRNFIIRFWFLSRFERILIWNYIFRSVSAQCSLDSLWKFVSFFFFGQNIVPWSFPNLFPFLFSPFDPWLSLERDLWIKSYSSRPLFSSLPHPKKRDHFCTCLDFSEFLRLWLSPCRSPWISAAAMVNEPLPRRVGHRIYVHLIIQHAVLAGFWNHSSKVTTYKNRSLD